MTESQIFAMQAENETLKAEKTSLVTKVSAICKIYATLRPILKFLKFFSFVKKGAKGIIDGAIAVLDEACNV